MGPTLGWPAGRRQLISRPPGHPLRDHRQVEGEARAAAIPAGAVAMRPAVTAVIQGSQARASMAAGYPGNQENTEAVRTMETCVSSVWLLELPHCARASR